MTPMSLRDDHSWQGSYCRHRCLFCTKPILRDRSLGGVGARAAALLDKGKAARILDKAKDSAEVVALVEELRQAIVIYQVSAGDC